MTWGDVKLIALQTMFSNEGPALSVDDINQEYLYAMPGKANEAMQQIAAVALQDPPELLCAAVPVHRPGTGDAG